jgi:hypothetical protein
VGVRVGGKAIMVKTLILKLVELLKNRKVGREKNEQKIIVANEVNITIINNK